MTYSLYGFFVQNSYNEYLVKFRRFNKNNIYCNYIKMTDSSLQPIIKEIIINKDNINQCVF